MPDPLTERFPDTVKSPVTSWLPAIKVSNVPVVNSEFVPVTVAPERKVVNTPLIPVTVEALIVLPVIVCPDN